MHTKLHKYFSITLKHKTIVEKFVKKVYDEKHSFIEVVYVHIGIASVRHFQYVQITYVTKIKKSYFEIYIYQEPCPLISFAFLKHLNLPIRIKIHVYLSLYGKLFIFP